MSGISKSLEGPDSLVKYEASIQIYDSMKRYHQQRQSKEQRTQIPPKNEEIIDSILPPRDWQDQFNKLHIQYVSHQPASREDVVELTDRLDKMLDDRQARKSGICGIRQELFSQAFDEIIRQVAVDSAERGLLLMRVRDECKMSIAAYLTVYQSSVCYGMSKQVDSQQGMDQLQSQYLDILSTKNQLEQKKELLISEKQLFEKQMKENKEIHTIKRKQELELLRAQEDNLRNFLELVRSESK